jgi:hypothetical protein
MLWILVPQENNAKEREHMFENFYFEKENLAVRFKNLTFTCISLICSL